VTTPVAFHTGVADPVPFACRLLRKAVRQGARVLVTAPAPVLAALDTALWTFEAQGFVPHVRIPGIAEVAQRSPIWLCDGAVPPDAPRLRVNLGAEPPRTSAEVDRVIEIVGDTPEARQAGRERWRHYESDWGVKPDHHPAAA
jgi:DNA polymerase III subunit chi